MLKNHLDPVPDALPENPSLKNRFGIILAAGDGKRLQSLVRQFRGDHLPKQYVNFIGRRSMLEHTFHRVEKLLSPERVFTVIDKSHLRYQEVEKQLSQRSDPTVVIQPENKDTGPGLIFPLLRLYKSNPESVVSVFPSDHFVLEETLFMNYVETAFRLVERDSNKLVLLGVKPHSPETEYGYIVPNGSEKYFGASSVMEVSRFVEKPSPYDARGILRLGGLWNTLVMTFKTKTLLGMIRKTVPSIFGSFQQIWNKFGTSEEPKSLEEIYGNFSPLNFSKDILENLPRIYPSALLVLPVRGVFWSDWGSPERLVGTLLKLKWRERSLLAKQKNYWLRGRKAKFIVGNLNA